MNCCDGDKIKIWCGDFKKTYIIINNLVLIKQP